MIKILLDLDLGSISNILGIDVERNGATGNIKLSQKKYIEELLSRFNMQKVAPTLIESNTKISKQLGPKNDKERIEMQKKPYKELVGGLIYLANATSPDIVFATLSRFCSDPGKAH